MLLRDGDKCDLGAAVIPVETWQGKKDSYENLY
jgi:hypothetical protein